MIKTKNSLTGHISAKSELTGKLSNPTVEVFPDLVDLEVNPTNEKQVFNHENEFGYDEVVVNPVSLQNKIVKPLDEEQVIKADEGYAGLNEVTVEKAKPIPYKPHKISFYEYRGTDLDYELENLDTSNLVDGKYMFQSCSYVTSLNVSGFDTSNMNSMSRMFNSCSSIENTIDVSSFNTSNVTSMQEMFNWCSNITHMDVSNFDTGKVTNMNMMFATCRKLERITGISNFNVSRLQSCSDMFEGCLVLTELDLSGWNTTSITSCTDMFNNCKALTSLKLGNINICNATNISGMFNSCESLTELDLSKWETTKATNMYQLFCNCKSLKRLDIRNFTLSKVTSHANMFMNIPADCLIIVKDDTAKEWVLARRSDLTNVKTVAELG